MRLLPRRRGTERYRVTFELEVERGTPLDGNVLGITPHGANDRRHLVAVVDLSPSTSAGLSAIRYEKLDR